MTEKVWSDYFGTAPGRLLPESGCVGWKKIKNLFIACLNRSMMGKRVCGSHRWSFLIE